MFFSPISPHLLSLRPENDAVAPRFGVLSLKFRAPLKRNEAKREIDAVLSM